MIGHLRRRQRLWILWFLGLPLVGIWGMTALDLWQREGRIGWSALLFALGVAGLAYETVTELRRKHNEQRSDDPDATPQERFRELPDGLLALSLDAHRADMVASILRGLDIPVRLENQHMAAITQFPLFFKARLLFPAEHREAVEQILGDLNRPLPETDDEDAWDEDGPDAEWKHDPDESSGETNEKEK